MFVINIQTYENHEAEILPLTASDFSVIKKSKQFGFDWQAYKGKEVYKLRIKSDKEILGLIHIEDHPEPGFDYLEIIAIEIRLADQKSKTRKYDRIAGCLFAFAARLAFMNGHAGMVFLVAKTEKAKLFHSKYGFQYLGRMGVLGMRMASEDKNSLSLIKKYLE